MAQYIEPMQNRHYYGSYADALKRLNLLAKELNRVHNVNEGISLFTEDKKYFLKTPKPEGGEDMGEAEASTPPPPPAPMPEPMPAPAEGGETPPPAEPEGGEEPMGMEGDMPEMPSDEMPEGGPEDADTDVTFKSIQKLTGKLAQKIRDFQSKGEEELSSKDAKYVVNSILSSLADNLEDDDKDDIIEKLESEEGGEDKMMGSEEMPDKGEEMPDEGMEMPDGEEEPSMKGGEVGENYNMEGDINEKYLDKVMGGLFGESKVDKILSNYFVLSENEIKFRNEKKKQKELFLEQKKKSDKNQIVKLSESNKQRKVAVDVINSFPEMKFIGKTNKGNLVFEHNNKQLKVSPKGELL